MTPEEPEAADFAIIIGINRYPHLGALKGPVEDASAFERWVVEKGGVKPENVLRALSSDDVPDGEPTQDAVDRQFLRLWELGNGTGSAGRRLYVFMAGHGIAQSIDEASLLTANARDGYFEAHVPSRCYCNWFRMAAYFEEIILFVDCCRTEYPDEAVRPFPRPMLHSPGAGKIKYLYGFAARYGQPAREDVRGFFSQALLDGLVNGRTSEGTVTATSLKEFLLNHPSLASHRGRQDPEILAPDDFVLARYPREAGCFQIRLTVRFKEQPLPAPRARIRGGDVQPREVDAVKDGVFELSVPRGLYAIEVGSAKGLFEVTGTEGAIDVELR